MAFFKSLASLFTSDAYLHKAASEGLADNVAKSLAIGKNPNSYYLGYTPLQSALLHGKPASIPLLLEAKADPNAICKSKYFTGKTLQLAIARNDASEIKILALYGADLTGITFNSSNQHFREFISTKALEYKQRKDLECSLITAHSTDEKAKIYTKLSQWWAKQSLDESNPIFLNHYHQQARRFQTEAQQLILKNTPTVSTADEELKPLITQPVSTATKLKIN